MASSNQLSQFCSLAGREVLQRNYQLPGAIVLSRSGQRRLHQSLSSINTSHTEIHTFSVSKNLLYFFLYTGLHILNLLNIPVTYPDYEMPICDVIIHQNCKNQRCQAIINYIFFDITFFLGWTIQLIRTKNPRYHSEKQPFSQEETCVVKTQFYTAK